MDFSFRHEAMKKRMAEEDIDVACILKPHNIAYLAGYAPICAGVILYSSTDPLFCTLWLDGAEARRLCRIENITGYVFPGETLIEKMARAVKKHRPFPRRMGLEKDFILLRDFEALRHAFPDTEFVNITPMVDRLRAIKSAQEIDHIRRSAAISDKAMEAALTAVRSGVTELDVAAEAEYVMKKMGSEKAAFSTFIASGERTLLAHPMASRRKIRPGEPVVIDLGATWEGYASDICRTTFAGQPDQEQISFLRTVLKAQEAAAGALREGTLCSDVFDKAYAVFQEAGISKALPDDIGYGVGLRQSEFYPVIEKGSPMVLKENMVVALLQTTSYSKKMGGMRIEDTFWITRPGYEKLTNQVQPHL